MCQRGTSDTAGVVLVDAGDEQCHALRARHRLALLALVALAEVDGQVAHGLGDLLDGHRLFVVEVVVLRLNARLVDQDAFVS